ncbi:MAG: alginate lyase family protein [Bacteroidales bacterium]|nr:alginate lyase family protein [Bacteroidales bacterium]
MKKFLTTLMCLCLVCAGALAQGMHPDSQINYVKKQIKQKNETIVKAYEQLKQAADQALETPTHALKDFSVPGFYINPDAHRKNSKSLQTDAFNAYACALCYRLSGEKKYAQKACRIMDEWAYLNERFSEYDGSLVMAYSGTGLVNAALLMKNQKIWKKESKKQFGQWVSRVYNKAADSIRYRANNWADWGRYASVLSASYLGDKAEILKNAELIRSDIKHKIAKDGSMPEETRRGANGIWYTYFSLAPITAASWIIYNESGINLFREDFDGIKFKMALDYLLYYSNHPDEWPHFKKVNKPQPGYWPYMLFEAMKGIYHEDEYATFTRSQQPIMCDKHHFAWTFPTLMPLQMK